MTFLMLFFINLLSIFAMQSSLIATSVHGEEDFYKSVPIDLRFPFPGPNDTILYIDCNYIPVVGNYLVMWSHHSAEHSTQHSTV